MTVAVLVALCTVHSLRAQSGGGYVIAKSTIDGGGARTAGQADAGDPAGVGYVLNGGFWGPAFPNAPTRGDDVCAGGSQDAQPCSQNSDCPGGFCGMKNRYISITPTSPGQQTVIQITALTLPASLGALVGDVWYADAPAVVNENPSPGPTLKVAALGCDSGPGGFDANVRDWGAEGLINITGAIIVPVNFLDISVVVSAFQGAAYYFPAAPCP